MDSTMRRVQVHLADAPTDVLVYLAGVAWGDLRTLDGVCHAVAPTDAVDARETVANALRTLIDAGYVEGRVIDGWRMYWATNAGRLAVAEALAQTEVSGG